MAVAGGGDEEKISLWDERGRVMRYKHFEDLPVWRKAIDLAFRVHALGVSGELRAYGGLRDQIERAALSVSNNIAEGFERGTRDELISFLYIARGSAGEVRSMIHLGQRLLKEEPAVSELREIHEVVLDISRQLGGWIESLKNTETADPRDRNDAARQSASEARRRSAFVQQLQRIAKGELDSYTEENAQ
jgi:four helix bundle protein